VIRPVAAGDAEELAALYTLNRDFLAPFEPARGEDFFTPEGQRDRLEQYVREAEAGDGLRFVIVDGGAIAGTIGLSEVIRGPLQLAEVGYWVDRARNGRGLATAAVADIVSLAFGELELHRLEAGTLLHNVASQMVLDRNGFTPFGVAPNYLRIAGAWCDHVLFQRTSEQAPRPLGAAALARRITFLADPQ
jgi:ribosomal-protein-alanine N-acetyltransferase